MKAANCSDYWQGQPAPAYVLYLLPSVLVDTLRISHTVFSHIQPPLCPLLVSIATTPNNAVVKSPRKNPNRMGQPLLLQSVDAAMLTLYEINRISRAFI